ncbi:MAG TPA: ribulose-phosphate 3-epimerase [Candidatus Babeliales bacterium]|jgi:ribulose-phosphate 3-epimerase|nr:ribulose-phosphate 3-epimerase [Candidatus Babeliales bacterium]
MIRIYPSLIGGDILALRDQIRLLDSHCAGYHLDLMDGHFVPNITWGPAYINAIAKATTKQLWVHMMVTDPAFWFDRLELPLESMVDFHIETAIDHYVLMRMIQHAGMQAGIAISPGTSLQLLDPLLSLVDYVLIMSVQPGFSGQQFIAESIERIQELAAIKSTKHYDFSIAVDGGITMFNINQTIEAGAAYIAIASGLFANHKPVETLQHIMKNIKKSM